MSVIRILTLELLLFTRAAIILVSTFSIYVNLSSPTFPLLHYSDLVVDCQRVDSVPLHTSQDDVPPMRASLKDLSLTFTEIYKPSCFAIFLSSLIMSRMQSSRVFAF